MEAPATINMDKTRRQMLMEGGCFGEHLVQHNPWIKCLGISGSLSNPKLWKHNDIDFFIITEAGHVWDCFLSCLWHGFWYARKFHRPRTYFCFNYLIDETYAIQEIENTKEAANEYLNVIILFGHDTYQKILEQKHEIKYFYPERYTEKQNELLNKKTFYKNHTRYKQKRGMILQSSICWFYRFFEWKRKKKQKWLMRINGQKIYSNKYVIRSHYF